LFDCGITRWQEEEVQTTERDAAASPLRIGIMVNSLTCPRWVAKIVDDIQSSSFAQVVFVLHNAAPTTSARKTLRQRLKTYWTHSLFERYKRWDRDYHRAELDAFEETDLTTRLREIPALSAKTIQKGFVDRFTLEDVAQVRAANLDVLFRFGFRIIRGDILLPKIWHWVVSPWGQSPIQGGSTWLLGNIRTESSNRQHSPDTNGRA